MQKAILNQQQNEITESKVYEALGNLSTDKHNKKILLQISKEEKKHYKFWENITKKKLTPNDFQVKKYTFISKIFGLSFGLRLMEKNEVDASKFYNSIKHKYSGVQEIQEDEEKHERQLIGILKDQRLDYAGAIVLGLNDALVEFTGTLAGLTFAFENNLIVGGTGLIMGIAASLSMAASGYLASREDENSTTNPITSAIYTGLAYIFTVIFLVFPYFIQDNPYIALAGMLTSTIIIIALYTYYISVAKNISFKSRFVEMVTISLGVAILSFGIGMLVREFIGV